MPFECFIKKSSLIIPEHFPSDDLRFYTFTETAMNSIGSKDGNFFNNPHVRTSLKRLNYLTLFKVITFFHQSFLIESVKNTDIQILL